MSGREELLAELGVSRETSERLERYEQLLKKWNPAINLVAASTLTDIWTRHFHDSAAAFRVAAAENGRWTDLGSGGGFPGAVVAVLAAELAPNLQVTCVEADVRKAAFLRTLAVDLLIKLNVLSRRIEDTPPQNAQVISARALAPLTKLLGYAERHLGAGGRAVFLKGESWRQEVEEALETWRFSVEDYPSPTNPGSAILVVGDISRA